MTARRPAAHAVLQAFMETDMATGCELLAPDVAQQRHAALNTEGLQSVLYSPHELRVESRTAIPRLAAWLQETKGVDFRFGEAVIEIDTPRVRTTRGEDIDAACGQLVGQVMDRTRRSERYIAVRELSTEADAAPVAVTRT